MKKKLLIPLKIIAFTTAAGITFILILFWAGFWTNGIRFAVYDIKNATHWREKTSPLSQNVIQDICQKFEIPPNDSRCKPGAIVYAPDFFGDITRDFRAKNGVYSTYGDVQKKIGSYQFKYEPPVTENNGLTYFVARYDLRGDRVYPIVMFFYGDGRLFRIIADVGD
jgi:hypothetical protein